MATFRTPVRIAERCQEAERTDTTPAEQTRPRTDFCHLELVFDDHDSELSCRKKDHKQTTKNYLKEHLDSGAWTQPKENKSYW